MVRDTDADWNLIATHQPYYGVLANERYLAENLTPQAIDEFYESGKADIDYVIGVLKRVAGGDVEPARALDFGCGAGRLSLAIQQIPSWLRPHAPRTRRIPQRAAHVLPDDRHVTDITRDLADYRYDGPFRAAP